MSDADDRAIAKAVSDFDSAQNKARTINGEDPLNEWPIGKTALTLLVSETQDAFDVVVAMVVAGETLANLTRERLLSEMLGE